jgi:hypothetical protein
MKSKLTIAGVVTVALALLIADLATNPQKKITLVWNCEDTDCLTGIESTTNLLTWKIECCFDAGFTNYFVDFDRELPCKFYRAFNLSK